MLHGDMINKYTHDKHTQAVLLGHCTLCHTHLLLYYYEGNPEGKNNQLFTYCKYIFVSVSCPLGHCDDLRMLLHQTHCHAITLAHFCFILTIRSATHKKI